MDFEQAREIKNRLVKKLFTPEMTDADMVALNKANDVIKAHKTNLSTPPASDQSAGEEGQ